MASFRQDGFHMLGSVSQMPHNVSDMQRCLTLTQIQVSLKVHTLSQTHRITQAAVKAHKMGHTLSLTHTDVAHPPGGRTQHLTWCLSQTHVGVSVSHLSHTRVPHKHTGG